ncbi:MAG: AIR synthase-related protein, partial [Candidatus Anstonellales archaeon]
DKIFIITAGIGTITKDLNFHYNRIEPGDVIIINGNIAEHGLAILLSRGAYGFRYDIQSDCNSLKSLLKNIFSNDEINSHIKFLRDPTRGGIAAVLNEIVEFRKDLCLEIYEEKVPISTEATYVCELLGIDPFTVANEGKMIMIASKKVSDKIIEIFKKHPLGKEAMIIGEVSDTYKGKVVLHTKYGGKKVLEMPIAEELPRIC